MNTATCTFPGTPAALGPAAASPSSGLDAAAFDFLRELVLRRSAIVLEPDKGYLIESRLAPLARRHGFESPTALAAALKLRPNAELERQIVEAMTTNESSFFRDGRPFDALRTVILPELVSRRQIKRKLRIWSAACSTGQELYTVAMILREHFAELKSWNVDLLGTDLSNEVLGRAREGLYNQVEINRGLPAPLLVRHFRREGLHWRISPELRQMARFEQLNLIEPFPRTLGSMDVVLLRNVLIYFSPETKRQILGRVRQVLSSDGYLFLGGAETTLHLDDAYERVAVDQAVCYRLRPPPSAS